MVKGNPSKKTVKARHPSGHRSKRKQQLWEGPQGLKNGRKWNDEVEAWLPFYPRPLRRPRNNTRRVWDEWNGWWVKGCGCGGVDANCIMQKSKCSTFM